MAKVRSTAGLGVGGHDYLAFFSGCAVVEDLADVALLPDCVCCDAAGDAVCVCACWDVAWWDDERRSASQAPERVPMTPIAAAAIDHQRLPLAMRSSSLNCSRSCRTAMRLCHSFSARMCLSVPGFHPDCQVANSASVIRASSLSEMPTKPSAKAASSVWLGSCSVIEPPNVK